MPVLQLELQKLHTADVDMTLQTPVMEEGSQEAGHREEDPPLCHREWRVVGTE